MQLNSAAKARYIFLSLKSVASQTMRIAWLSKPGWICMAAAMLASSDCAAAAEPDFARDVRPILERSCFGCHGPEKHKSGYRLDLRDSALRGGDSGHPAIIPHDSSRSPLIRYVSGQVEDMLMPPASSGKPRLTEGEIAI